MERAMFLVLMFLLGLMAGYTVGLKRGEKNSMIWATNKLLNDL